MTDFVSVLNKIEESLTQEIDVNELAKSACMSIYEFRRIFSFVIGVPISEYIRKRRLSMAGEDILINGISVTDAAMKYQYEDISSFTRAFKEFHGVAPSEIAKKKVGLKMYTKVDFSLQVNGGNNVEYRIYEEDEYYIKGVKAFSKFEEKECCEGVWNVFENSSFYQTMIKEGDRQIYASYENEKDGVLCCIGRKGKEVSNGEYAKIPKSTWVAFTLRSTDDEFVNGYYGDVVCKWLNSSMFCRREGLPNLEVFPIDMENEGFEWEIHIPIKVK